MQKEINDEYDKTELNTNPYAHQLAKIRHCAEHRCLITVEIVPEQQKIFTEFVQAQDLADKTLILLNLLRELIIYLALSVNIDLEIKNDNVKFQNYLNEWVKLRFPNEI